RGGFFAFSLMAAVAVVAVSRPGSRLEPALGSKALRWVGTRSYGLYLWHWPIFVFTRPQLDLPLTGIPDLVLRLGLVVALAEASYRLVEKPIRSVGLKVWVGGVLLRMSRAGEQLQAWGTWLRRGWENRAARPDPHESHACPEAGGSRSQQHCRRIPDRACRVNPGRTSGRRGIRVAGSPHLHGDRRLGDAGSPRRPEGGPSWRRRRRRGGPPGI